MDHDRDPKHAPDEPMADQLPVEPELDKSQDPRESGRNPQTEPSKEKRVDNL
jgi:hypothetical protein